MIKNRTPYLGKIRLALQKFPYYTGNDKLNKVHLNLGFIKLVSRITPVRDENGWVVNPNTVKLIEQNTGLKVRPYTVDDGGPRDKFTLYNSCIHPDGHYVGSIEDGLWYYDMKLRATKGSHPHTAWSKETKKWTGYSHRAYSSFGKGDKLFIANWVPTDSELDDYIQYYKKDLSKWNPNSDLTFNQWVAEYIPFNLRGSKTISSYEQAYEAAVNFAKYVS